MRHSINFSPSKLLLLCLIALAFFPELFTALALYSGTAAPDGTTRFDEPVTPKSNTPPDIIYTHLAADIMQTTTNRAFGGQFPPRFYLPKISAESIAPNRLKMLCNTATLKHGTPEQQKKACTPKMKCQLTVFHSRQQPDYLAPYMECAIPAIPKAKNTPAILSAVAGDIITLMRSVISRQSTFSFQNKLAIAHHMARDMYLMGLTPTQQLTVAQTVDKVITNEFMEQLSGAKKTTVALPAALQSQIPLFVIFQSLKFNPKPPTQPVGTNGFNPLTCNPVAPPEDMCHEKPNCVIGGSIEISGPKEVGRHHDTYRLTPFDICNIPDADPSNVGLAIQQATAILAQGGVKTTNYIPLLELFGRFNPHLRYLILEGIRNGTALPETHYATIEKNIRLFPSMVGHPDAAAALIKTKETKLIKLNNNPS